MAGDYTDQLLLTLLFWIHHVFQPNNDAYRQRWESLNMRLEQLRQAEGLSAALHALMTDQIESGFIRDELSAIERFRLPCAFAPEREFSAQFNPARAQRFHGADTDKPRATLINDNCFLCAENVQWQHQGAELGFEITEGTGHYVAWMNPYPILPCHTVIASRNHRPQSWKQPGSRSLPDLVNDLVQFSQQLPGWIGFYNGVGAGASIPYHLHFHFLPRPDGYEEMPIERAAREHCANPHVDTHYPLSFMHWGGSAASVLIQAQQWLEDWNQGSGAMDEATANIIACSADSGDLDLYFIPRHQRRARAEGLQGVVGGFEAMGEIVCSTREEKHRLDSGQVDYEAIAAMLRQVSEAF
jgi:diadenosine tetraphosphate (Ap4A) HIT family hydrolase